MKRRKGAGEQVGKSRMRVSCGLWVGLWGWVVRLHRCCGKRSLHPIHTTHYPTHYLLPIPTRNSASLLFRANPFYSVLIREKGFSLLEVMVAVIVLGFGLLAIMHLFPIGLKASKISQDTTVASFLAQAKIEELRNTGWASLSSGTTTEDYNTIQITVDKVTYSYPGFKRITTIQDVETTDPELERITVEVFYKPYGAERSVKLVTLFTDYKEKM